MTTVDCAGVHSWTYHYADGTMTAACAACGTVEPWDEHLARQPRSGDEAFGRLAASFRLLGHRVADGYLRPIVDAIARMLDRKSDTP